MVRRAHPTTSCPEWNIFRRPQKIPYKPSILCDHHANSENILVESFTEWLKIL